MPEPSDSDRRKAAQLSDTFANVRLVEALERGWEIAFRCQFCGASKTWRRDIMLGRARPLLNCTMTEIQAKAVCPRCPGRMPIMTFNGVLHPADPARARWEVMNALMEAGLIPAHYGYGHGGR